MLQSSRVDIIVYHFCIYDLLILLFEIWCSLLAIEVSENIPLSSVYSEVKFPKLYGIRWVSLRLFSF